MLRKLFNLFLSPPCGGDVKLEAKLPVVSFISSREFSDKKFFYYPSPDVSGFIINEEGCEVAFLRFSFSPLLDCLYVLEIKVYQDFQGMYYGFSILKRLYDEFKVPLIPVWELGSSKGFWNRAREKSGELFVIGEKIADSDAMAREKSRISNLLNRLN